jgi:hypothetical protein
MAPLSRKKESKNKQANNIFFKAMPRFFKLKLMPADGKS